MSTRTPRGCKADRLVSDAAMAAAVRATEQILADHPERIADMSLPLNQYIARCYIEKYRHQFEAGDSKAMLAAIQQCSLASIPMPKWVADAFNRAYNAVDHATVGSWDEAFGRPYKKGTQLASTRKRKADLFNVLNAVGDLAWTDPVRAVDVGYFEEIGARVGCKATRAAELYYEARKELPALFERLSRKLES